MPYLKFISDQDLCSSVAKVVEVIEKAQRDADKTLHSNVLDPFSAFFHGVTHATPYEEWIEEEKIRQAQKSMQNAIGKFHQNILGAVPGWINLGTGKGLDIINKKRKIIAEVKNKHNTTKGNHLVKVYDDIKASVKKNPGYTGYYVGIIPKGKKKYNTEFTPSEKGKRRPKNNNIRIIDGMSFYELVTTRKNALQELFEVLPKVIKDKHGYKLDKKEEKKYFKLFGIAFSTE